MICWHVSLFNVTHTNVTRRFFYFFQTDLASSISYSLQPTLTVGDLKGFYPDIKVLKLKCCPTQTRDTPMDQTKVPVQEKVNAFSILMCGAKVYPTKKDTW